LPPKGIRQLRTLANENIARAIGVLVNSAGAAKRTPPDELTPASWRAAMDAKYFSYINAIDPLMKRTARRGQRVIVNIIGAGGKLASPTHLAGGAADAALMLVTAGLANAYAGRGLRVVGVNPGLTETGRVAEGMESSARLAGTSIAEARRRSIESIPLARMALPEEIANAVAFLASHKASYITGVTKGWMARSIRRRCACGGRWPTRRESGCDRALCRSVPRLASDIV
jgi:NAD(P)-dependent dehydrogenase (short-subunit alcohol dehydrogenase family)